MPKTSNARTIINRITGAMSPKPRWGSAWLDIMKLVINKLQGIFSLDMIEFP